MIKPIQDPEEAAKRLMQEAYQRGSADNITCVVVRFLANQGGSSFPGSAWTSFHSHRSAFVLYMGILSVVYS